MNNISQMLLIGELVLRYGPDWVMKLINLFSKNEDPTIEEINTLLELAKKTYADYTGHTVTTTQ